MMVESQPSGYNALHLSKKDLKSRVTFLSAWLVIGVLISVRLTAHPVPGQREDQSKGALQVTILGPGGLKIAGASVSIELEGASFRLKGVTRGDGTYLASQLESGRYRIGVAAPCYAASQGEVKVEAGHRATATITLAVASLTPAAPGGVTCPAAPGDADMQFSDSGELKPGELSGAVDAAGYSSQAETQGAEMRHALADLAAAGPKQTDNQSEPGVFDRGNNLLLQGDYSGASSVFQQGAAQYPHSAEMLLGLGVASYSRGRYEEAVGVLCQAVDLNPTDRRAYFFLVQAYAASPVRTEPVLQRLGSYAAREPQDAAAQYYYAFGLWRARAGAGQVDGTGEATSRSDAERVEQLLRSAIALDPSLVEAHFQLGVVLSEQGKNTQAITELQRTVTLQPDWAEAHYRLARLYGQTGEKDKAQRELADYQRLQKKGVAQDPRLQDEVRRFLGTGGR